MPKFLSDEFFAELQTALAGDAKWTESTKGVKSTILLSVKDTGSSHLVNVEGGVTTIQKAEAGAPAEFSFEGTYDAWTKLAKGEMDMQSAVLKGQLKFKGSITKILMYRDRFLRIAEILNGLPKDF
ncbi:MAG: SCP2 sterol-binding domain-containing protein [Nitrososphaerales archaeon]|nr:SCP2 sterol-binding domain-containing protein [Nitrososphaerales archaeon]